MSYSLLVGQALHRHCKQLMHFCLGEMARELPDQILKTAHESRYYGLAGIETIALEG